MPHLVWDQTSEKLYETGIRKTVLYPYSQTNGYKPGVAWNGVTGMTEKPSGAEETALYADDDKYVSLRSKEQFGLTIEAYMSPDEFDECDGTKSPIKGVTIGQQSRKTFGLSYRTVIGNDTELDDYAYKLHLVYGCTASPSERAYKTVNDSPDISPMSWDVSTVPVDAGDNYRKTSIITIDSSKVPADKLSALEDILYDATNATLPLPSEVVAIFADDPSGLTLRVMPESGSTELFGKLVSDLQSDVSVVEQTGTRAITGVLNYVTGYTEFSSDVSLQSGNFLALKFEADEGATTTVEVVNGYSGPVTLDSDMNIVLRIANNNQQVKVETTKGTEKVTKVYSLSDLLLEEE